MADIKIKPTDWNIDAAKYAVKPGDRLILAGPTRAEIEFHNLKGTKEAPIVVTATEKIVIKGVNPGGRIVNFLNCSFVRITGGDGMLIEITGGAMGVDFREISTNVEADHLYIHDIGYSALNAKTEPTTDPKTWRGNFTLRDVYFHDNVVANTGGEGTYVGLSHAHTDLKEHEVDGVRIINNTFKNIGCDGIQVGAALNCFIQNNIIDGAGMAGRGIDASGIQINPGTNAEVSGNTISNCKIGFGIFAGGRGGSWIHDNTISNCGGGLIAGKPAGGAILTAAYAPIDPAGHRIENNKLINIGRVGGEIYSLTYWDNNPVTLISGAKESSLFVPVAQFITKPIPKPPVITKEVGTIEVVTTDGVTEVFAITATKRIKIQ